MPDKELDATSTAYNAIKDLDRGQWTRCLNYLAKRMAEDDRAAYIGNEFAGADVMAPKYYCVSGNLYELHETDECAAIEADLIYEAIAINTVATIKQRYAVVIPGDDCIVQWFDLRDEAEHFIATLRNEPCTI